MLTERLEFRAWLAHRDAATLAGESYRRCPKPPADGKCDSCGGLIGETPSQVGEECLVCLAERFGGDRAEEQLVKLFLGRLVRGAMDSDEVADDLVITTIQNAIREHEFEVGMSSGRGLERERKAAA